MWRISAVAFLACLSVQASSIVSYTCTVGAITATPCPETSLGLSQGVTDPPFDNVHASAYARAIQPALDNIIVDAASTAYYLPGCAGCPQPPASASSEAIVNDEDATSGPARPGVIEISEKIGSVHDQPSTNWSITEGSTTYSGCFSANNGFGCSGTRTLPFELGVPFLVNATAMGATSLDYSSGFPGGGQSDEVVLSFSLFEADGTPVGVYAIPEPSTCTLVFGGLAAWAIVKKRREQR